MNNNKLRFRMVFLAIFVVSVILVLILARPGGKTKYPASALDSFAQCLADKGITMYGADWCPHCQNEKKAFGDSFKYVPYVECPENIKQCLALGIEGYPTWIFPELAEGQAVKKFVGEQGIEKLAQESGCAITTND